MRERSLIPSTLEGRLRTCQFLPPAGAVDVLRYPDVPLRAPPAGPPAGRHRDLVGAAVGLLLSAAVFTILAYGFVCASRR